jgi:hypothetical protein
MMYVEGSQGVSGWREPGVQTCKSIARTSPVIYDHRYDSFEVTMHSSKLPPAFPTSPRFAPEAYVLVLLSHGRPLR